MDTADSSGLVLEDHSSIAVIGGGPAGSFFTYFALDFAKRLGLEVNIDVIEAKDFNRPGPLGCNHCGGIVSESLIQMLSTEGIVLPAEVIRRGIDSYTLHMEHGTTVIETPLREQRIASVYRGFGPKGSMDNGQSSFDNYLLDLCAQSGARLIQERVTKLDRAPKGICVTTNTGKEKTYDLVVGAVGLSKKSIELFDNILPAFAPPKTTKTHIAEFYMERSLIDAYFGNSMHVFLLNIPHIKFGALIPKGSYVTLVLLGDKINRDIVSAFLTSTAVRKCFPPSMDISSRLPCFCFPLINIRGARSAYDDRLVLIGDAASSKLYKNGIGSAYITGKAAARTAVFHGISRHDFDKNYQPVCRDLQSDNAIGKIVFALTGVIQKSGTLKKGLFNMVVGEQQKENEKRHMSAMLWDTFTGSAPYRDIIRRGLYPKTGISFLRNTLLGIFN